MKNVLPINRNSHLATFHFVDGSQLLANVNQDDIENFIELAGVGIFVFENVNGFNGSRIINMATVTIIELEKIE